MIKGKRDLIYMTSLAQHYFDVLKRISQYQSSHQLRKIDSDNIIWLAYGKIILEARNAIHCKRRPKS